MEWAWYCPDWPDRLELLGNMYENPELLEKKKDHETKQKRVL